MIRYRILLVCPFSEPTQTRSALRWLKHNRTTPMKKGARGQIREIGAVIV